MRLARTREAIPGRWGSDLARGLVDFLRLSGGRLVEFGQSGYVTNPDPLPVRADTLVKVDGSEIVRVFE